MISIMNQAEDMDRHMLYEGGKFEHVRSEARIHTTEPEYHMNDCASFLRFENVTKFRPMMARRL